MDSRFLLILFSLAIFAQAQTYVSFANTISDSTSLQFQITYGNGTVLLASPVAYKAFTTSFPIPAGTYNVTLIDSAVKRQSIAQNFTNGAYYTVAALSTVASADIIVEQNDLTPPQTGATFRVRLANAVVNSPALDVEIDKVRYFNATAYKTFTGYLELNAGAKNVAVYIAGTNIMVGLGTSVNFVGGTVVTLFLEASATNETVILQDTLQTSSYATVRFAHMVANAQNFDVYLGEKKIADNLAYTQVSNVANVLFSNQLVLKNAGTADVALNMTIVLDFQQTLIYAIGSLGDLKVNTTIDYITPVAGPSYGSVRLVHASAGIPAVDVYADGSRIASNIIFGDFSQALIVGAASNYTIELKFAGGNQTAVGPDFLGVPSGANLIVFVAGANVTVAKIVSTVTVVYQWAWVRVAHLSEDSAAAVAQFTPDLSSAVANTTSFTVVSYGQFSAYQMMLVAPSYYITFYSPTALALASGTVKIESQQYYTVTLEGLFTGVDPLNVGIMNDTLAYASNAADVYQVTLYNQVSQGTAGGKNVNIDLFLDGTLVASNVAFSDFSTAFQITAGEYVITAKVTGTAEVLQEDSLLLDTGVTGIVGIWVAGEYFTTNETNNKISIFADKNDKYTHLRVSHAIANAPAEKVMVYLETSYSSVKIADNLAFGQISGYYNFPTPAEYLTLRMATASATIASAIYAPVVGNNFAVVYGYYGNFTVVSVLDKVIVEPQGPAAFTIRFIHAVPFVGPVTFRWNGAIISDISTQEGGATEWATSTIDQQYRLEVINGQGTPIFVAENLKFATGGVYEFVIAGSPIQYFSVQTAALSFFRFRAINALAGVVSINVDGIQRIPAVEYAKRNGTEYIFVEAGSRTISVIDSTKTEILSKTINVNNGTYNFIISGFNAVNRRVDFQAAEVVLPTASNCRIRFISADLAHVLNVEGPAGTAEITNLTYLAQTDYIEYAPALIAFEILLGGAGEHTGLYNRTDRYYQGHSYSMFLMGDATSTTALLLEDYVSAPTASIRYLNAFEQSNIGANQTNAVAVFANSIFVQNVPYQTISPYVATEIPATGVVPFSMKSLDQTIVLGSATLLVNNSVSYTVYTYPLNGAIATFTIASVVDPLGLPSDGKIRVSMFNLIHGQDVIHEVKFNENVIFTNVTYGSLSGWAEIDQGFYDVAFNDVNNTLFSSRPDLRSSASAVFTLAAIGTPTNFKIVSFLDNGVGYTAPVVSSTAGFPGWAIALIVVGVILLVAAIAVAGWMIYKRRHTGYSTIPERDA